MHEHYPGCEHGHQLEAKHLHDLAEHVGHVCTGQCVHAEHSAEHAPERPADVLVAAEVGAQPPAEAAHEHIDRAAEHNNTPIRQLEAVAEPPTRLFSPQALAEVHELFTTKVPDEHSDGLQLRQTTTQSDERVGARPTPIEMPAPQPIAESRPEPAGTRDEQATRALTPGEAVAAAAHEAKELFAASQEAIVDVAPVPAEDSSLATVQRQPEALAEPVVEPPALPPAETVLPEIANEDFESAAVQPVEPETFLAGADFFASQIETPAMAMDELPGAAPIAGEELPQIEPAVAEAVLPSTESADIAEPTSSPAAGRLFAPEAQSLPPEAEPELEELIQLLAEEIVAPVISTESLRAELRERIISAGVYLKPAQRKELLTNLQAEDLLPALAMLERLLEQSHAGKFREYNPLFPLFVPQTSKFAAGNRMGRLVMALLQRLSPEQTIQGAAAAL